MHAKIRAGCSSTISKLTIEAKLQMKRGTKWVSASKVKKASYKPAVGGKKYSGYTGSASCKKGTFRPYFRVSGLVKGKTYYGNWGAGKATKNPCG